LTEPCADETGWTRVLIEKPFGHDLEGAKSLDKLLGKLFKEEQIFRIDHYLAKEALQNILAFRFSNSLFEPIWKREFVDKIHIKLYEKDGVGDRGESYDPIGALKDVGQNHMLMMLAAVAMDRPKAFTAPLIREERTKVLSKLVVPKEPAKKCTLKGQYKGYISETGVPVKSTTETYFRIKAYVNSSRWKRVPIYLESGKALSEAKTEIDVYFKGGKNEMEQNILTFRIQPDEGIKVKFFVKTPGYEFKTEPKTLKFKYADQISSQWQDIPNDYERLIHDAFIGDQTLFASTKEILASWKFIAAIMKGWNELPLAVYEKGANQVG
jgi:glucose-6-phosphate 1-dehydrogenase